MIASFAFWFVVLALLSAYLGLRIQLRHRNLVQAERAQRRALEQEFPPRTFDASALVPQLQRVRQDYTASCRQPSPASAYRAGLLAAARRLVSGFAYFRRTNTAHELHVHEA